MKRAKKILKPVVIKSVLVYLCKTLGLRKTAEEYWGGPQFIYSVFASSRSPEFTFCIGTESWGIAEIEQRKSVSVVG